jgi:hypothetical protein
MRHTFGVLTYEKRGFSTRYVTVTCRYTGAACLARGETGGTPVTPLHYL